MINTYFFLKIMKEKYFLSNEWAIFYQTRHFFFSFNLFSPHTDNPFIPHHCFNGRPDTCLQLVNYQIHNPYRGVYDIQTFRDNGNLSGYIGALAPHVAFYPAVYALFLSWYIHKFFRQRIWTLRNFFVTPEFSQDKRF